MDPRARALAKFVVEKLGVKRDENVVISGGTESSDFVLELYKEVLLCGAHPDLRVNIPGTASFFHKYAQKHQIDKFPAVFDFQVKGAQKYIGIESTANVKELAGCDSEKILARQKVLEPIFRYVCNGKPHIKRSTVAFPCVALAQEAEMSLNEYENFVYSACLQDWKKVGELVDKVLEVFRRGKVVHLVGDGVDLRFDIRGELACSDMDGENIPMGEVFMAPVRESVDGWIRFDYPAIMSGKEVHDIYLKFRDGKVIESTASKNGDFLSKVLATDENASYVGEFGIGMNPKVDRFSKNLLFDEKMGGTIHLALGLAYKENGGGNDSAIHWDIVKDMSRARIVLDGKVVQENGVWRV
jgi:aminopeptidase